MLIEPVLPSSFHGEGESPSATRWLGVVGRGSAPLRRRAAVPLATTSRSGVTVEEVAFCAWLRLDLARVFKIYEAGGVLEASSSLHRFMAECGGSRYQLPDELARDRTFAYSIAGVLYVDQMGSFLSDAGQADPRRFVLPEVAGIYVSPRPYAFSRPWVAVQKSSCSLMPLHAVGFAHNDWSAHRREEEADGSVFPLPPSRPACPAGTLPLSLWAYEKVFRRSGYTHFCRPS